MSDRAALVKFASTLPKGSEERRALLTALSKTASDSPLVGKRFVFRWTPRGEIEMMAPLSPSGDVPGQFVRELARMNTLYFIGRVEFDGSVSRLDLDGYSVGDIPKRKVLPFERMASTYVMTAKMAAQMISKINSRGGEEYAWDLSADERSALLEYIASERVRTPRNAWTAAKHKGLNDAQAILLRAMFG